jgi:hypothetical protein
VTAADALSRLARGARRIGRGTRRVAWRGKVRPLVVAALVAVVAMLASVVWPAVIGRTGESMASLGGGSTVRIGVSDGDSVPGYLAAQREELVRLEARNPTKPVYALVSLETYLTPRQIAAITVGAGPSPGPSPTTSPTTSPTVSPSVAPIAAYARVPLPRRQTELVRLPANRVPDDIVASMAKVADRKAEEAKAYLTRAGQDDGSRLLYESMAAVAAAEAAGYGAACACMYALVVRAAPVALTALAGRSGVRVVDAAPELTDAAYAVFVAPLPEQVDVVRPLPVDDATAPATIMAPSITTP